MLKIDMPAAASDQLLPFAARYIWWKSPTDAVRYPAQVIAQVMNIGDYADVQKLKQLVGIEGLANAVKNAEAGQFSPKSWHYWHYHLGLAELEHVPPLPVRLYN
jgi:hypothetical protein